MRPSMNLRVLCTLQGKRWYLFTVPLRLEKVIYTQKNVRAYLIEGTNVNTMSCNHAFTGYMLYLICVLYLVKL